jgi:hypothetical protein
MEGVVEVAREDLGSSVTFTCATRLTVAREADEKCSLNFTLYLMTEMSHCQ